jgi:hypothetical protein
MSRSVSRVLLVCLATGVVGTGVYAYASRKGPAGIAVKSQAGAFFPTEQLWIVKDVAAAVGNMATYADRAKPSGPMMVRQVSQSNAGLARFEVTPPGRAAVVVEITDHIWAPGGYAPLAAAVAGSGTACESPATPIVSALLQPTGEVIQRENARVSARLRTNMRCADAHAEAALLVGTLALREAAKSFNDPRRLISRMTAHLAMADALGVPADNGPRRLSEIVLFTLVGRERTALDRMNALDPSGSNGPLQSWIRALRMRNTSDWRILHDPDHATLLEQLEVVRAAEASLGDPRTLDFIEAIHDPADVPDWARIVMEGNPGVDAGNRFADSAVALELREAAEARKAYAPAVSLDSAEALVNELKVEPTEGPVGTDGAVWIIDWPMWAAVAERHLMTNINARDTHLDSVLAVKDRAKEFREQVARTFSGLRLYPLLAITLAPTKEEARPGMAGSVALIEKHPELVTHWMWKSVLMKETWAGLPARVPRAESWFTPSFPVGTVFEPNTRPWAANLVARFTAPQIAPFRDAAPYAQRLTWVSIGPEYDKAPAAVLKKEFGEMAAFNLGFALRIASAIKKEDPDAYPAAMGPVVAMGPERLLDLADYYVDHARLDAARDAYERWFTAGRDEVAIANRAEWMVRDYFDRHEYAKANALANRAARTYSARGLLAQARLYDWSGNPREAERYYRLEYERYDDPDDLYGFLLRQHRKGMEVDALKWKVFPGGIVPVVMPSLQDPPTTGIEVTSVGKLGERLGMRVGDIVVAVDGMRVQNLAQYYAVKTASLDPVMRVIVWRDLKYVEVTAPLRYGGVWGVVRPYPALPSRNPTTPLPTRRW